MNIFIEPSDVWLFRDGRPFAPSERGRAVSLFPPTPQTMQGVIRSLRLAQSGEPFDYRKWSEALKAEIGQPDNYGAVKLRGPLVAKRDGNSVQRFFPLPADLTKLQSGWHILSPHADKMMTNWPGGADLQPLLPPEGSEPCKFDGKAWLDESVFVAYLSETAPTDDTVLNESSLFVHEPRFGVQIDSHPKRPTEGMLYQIEFVRLQKHVGLLVEVEGVTLLRSGLLQLGGEARAGRYVSVDCDWTLAQEQREQYIQQMNDGKTRFKLYLATPALFAKGWLPDAIEAKTLQGNWRGIDMKLVSVAIGKAQSIGGRDIARGDVQRPMRRVVPAGSVYLFETEATVDQIMKEFDGQCVSDVGAEIGFGLTYIGGW